jgi:hypothetical protein
MFCGSSLLAQRRLDMSNGSNSGATGGIGLVTVILALVFLFVWPGPLRYEYRDKPGYAGFSAQPAAVKIDRMTHQIWDYEDGKWVKR